MQAQTVQVGAALAACLLLLLVLAVAASRLGGLGTSRATLLAAVRAAVQLAAVSLVIVAVVRSWALTVGFVTLMFAVAAWTAGRRVLPGDADRVRTTLLAAVPLAVGVLPVVALVLATGSVPLVGIAVVPVAGIVIGGTMTAISLAGRRALQEMSTRRGEVEAALAIGLLPRDAVLEIVRPSSVSALVPVLDQTRTVGLVTLPGAFVGVLIGSGDPVQAGAAQVLVLFALLAAETLAVLVTVELVARGRIR